MEQRFQQDEATPPIARLTNPEQYLPTEETGFSAPTTLAQWDEVDALLADVKSEIQKRRQAQRWLMGGLLGVYGLVLLAVLIQWAIKGKFETDVLISISGLAGMSGIAMAASQGQKDATKKLAQYNDKRAVGAFVEALEFGDKEMKQMAETKLIQLLPSLQASDSELLNEEQRRKLYRALFGKNRDLNLAILQAFRQVGDEKALPHVQRLTTSKDARVRETAQECLEFLKIKLEQDKASRQLLRASSALEAAQTAPDTLLRAAHGVSETEPEQLLRASHSEDASDETTLSTDRK